MTPSSRTPGTRAVAKERTRDALLSAGFVLAETTGLEGLSVNALVATASVAKGTFFHHFGDRTSYLVALHRRFHDDVFDDVRRTTASMPPGRERLAAMSVSYLDACLRRRGVRALILEARGQLPIQDEIMRRNSATVDLLTDDFVAMRRPRPRAAARLWLAANAECALMELDAGHADPETRAALSDLLDGPRLEA
ncbi:Uncharacterised protein [Mycolicibacterium vanbaalenii]|uniref:HTH tetR-type domain-containing protein n=1 Tax=Mycolicibacterium vanbaalenii TaxID=110539 RepID=A0A5S9R2S2_MYCVN|nr:TetR/AcrR family transcriptional regulator [Mycolicibacterium vanbaalenii]CAA0128397.1 Uncharacterised protein [Mycolicibacterium vanbaalenii]